MAVLRFSRAGDFYTSQGFFTEPERFWRKTAELFSDRKPTKALHSAEGSLGCDCMAVPLDINIFCHRQSWYVVSYTYHIHIAHSRSLGTPSPQHVTEGFEFWGKTVSEMPLGESTLRV